MQKTLKTVIKLVLSTALIVLLLQLVDTNSLVQTLQSVPLRYALILIILYLCGQIISAFKWWLIAHSSGVRVPFPKALSSYLIGMFVNCFGLGMVGGDVARGVLLATDQDSKTKSFATVVADRAHGLAILAILGTVATLLFGRESLGLSWLLFLAAIGIGLVLFWFFGPFVLKKIVPQNLKLQKIAEDISLAFPRNSNTVLLVSVVSLCFHLLQISLHLIMGLAIGVSIPFTVLLYAVPFTNILSSLPISWNGVGVRETGYVFFLSGFLAKEQAIAFGALWLLANTVSSLVGGLIGFFNNDLQALRNATQGQTTPAVESL